jgi:hypothetical protein
MNWELLLEVGAGCFIFGMIAGHAMLPPRRVK